MLQYRLTSFSTHPRLWTVVMRSVASVCVCVCLSVLFVLTW